MKKENCLWARRWNTNSQILPLILQVVFPLQNSLYVYLSTDVVQFSSVQFFIVLIVPKRHLICSHGQSNTKDKQTQDRARQPDEIQTRNMTNIKCNSSAWNCFYSTRNIRKFVSVCHNPGQTVSLTWGEKKKFLSAELETSYTSPLTTLEIPNIWQWKLLNSNYFAGWVDNTENTIFALNRKVMIPWD